MLSEVFGIEEEVMSMGTTADDAIDPRPHQADVLLECALKIPARLRCSSSALCCSATQATP